MRRLYKEDLEKEISGGCPCGDPLCEGTAAYIHSRCHTSSPTWTFYHKGILVVECAVCRERIAEIVVAHKNLFDVEVCEREVESV